MASEIPYRFPKWKDAPWNSYERQKERYEIIAPYLGADCVGAEIGVYKGGFGEFLLPHCQKLYLVDPWYRNGAFWKSDIENDSRVDTVIDILSKYRDEIHQQRIEVVVDYSRNFFWSIKDETFDFIYVDSSHKYEQTVEELELARPKMKQGGIITGDDYSADPKSKHYGVCRAVHEFADRHQAEVAFVKNRQWGVRL